MQRARNGAANRSPAPRSPGCLLDESPLPAKLRECKKDWLRKGRNRSQSSARLTSNFRALAGRAFISLSDAKAEPFDASPRLAPGETQHRGALGSNTKGSSLPNVSNTPVCKAFCR
jgi:hypothetical protein